MAKPLPTVATRCSGTLVEVKVLTMSWCNKYWDTIDQLYWDPKLLGLFPIPRAEIASTEGCLTIPRSRVRNGGSIYARRGTAKENATRMRRLEEPLNHIFDLTFALAPSTVLARMFLRPFGFVDDGPFLRLGREVAGRYPGFGDGTTTQQDGYFVSDRSLIGVELKVASHTWPGQLLKYLALMVAEEKLTGLHEQVCLLYITPSEHPDAAYSQCGADSKGRLEAGFVGRVPKSEIKGGLAKMVETDAGHFASIAERLTVRHVGWSKIAKDASAVAAEQDTDQPGGETLHRLMSGFAEAVRTHSGCVVSI